jgi:hypothetical protein
MLIITLFHSKESNPSPSRQTLFLGRSEEHMVLYGETTLKEQLGLLY